jgi:hypothetical protein
MTEQNDDQKKLRQRNIAIALVLLFMVAMFFISSMVKVQESMNVS